MSSGSPTSDQELLSVAGSGQSEGELPTHNRRTGKVLAFWVALLIIAGVLISTSDSGTGGGVAIVMFGGGSGDDVIEGNAAGRITSSDPPAALAPPVRAKAPLLLSILAFEPMWYLRDLLHNIVSFTDPSTLVVVHLCARTRYNASEIAELRGHPRILLNPVRLKTTSYNSVLTAAHLRNILYAGSEVDFDHVMLWSSNSRFIRQGVEAHVRLHGSSLGVPPAKIPASVKRWIVFQKIDVEMYKWPKPRTFWDPRAVKQRVLNWEWFRRIFDLPVGKNKTQWNLAVKKSHFQFLWSKHEGAFFPGPLMLRLAQKADGIPGFWKAVNNYKVYLEEFLLQTWAQNHASEAAPGTSFPVVLCWTTSHGAKSTPKELKAVSVKQIQATLRAAPGFFGVKAVSRDLDQDYHGTRAFLRRKANQLN